MIHEQSFPQPPNKLPMPLLLPQQQSKIIIIQIKLLLLQPINKLPPNLNTL